jgi:hypothetical protein
LSKSSKKDRPTRSYSVTLPDGSVQKFSTLDDYVAFYGRLGADLTTGQGLANHRNQISELFYDWTKQGQLACLFARILAANPSAYKWHSHVIPDALGIPDLPESLELHLTEPSRDDGTVQFIFPDIRTPAQVVDLINSLCRGSQWYWTASDIEPPPAGMQSVGLRWVHGSVTAVSHVLGFAPFEGMPRTRRAPFTAIVMRVGSVKRAPKAKIENGRIQLHLADMPHGMDERQFGTANARTESARGSLVEPELNVVAKARVTFCLSASDASRLVKPTDVVVTAASSS